jgi:Protein of unknown function (DUF551)
VSDWNYVGDCLPENGVEVLTKIDNEKGCRNETSLKRQGNLWFFPDMSIYVYYTPTHWKPLAAPPAPGTGER